MNPLHGLYAITDNTLMPDDETLLTCVRAAILGGAQIIQYRDKTADTQKRYRQACLLNELCRTNARTFLINDDVKLALACEAHGVHLGQQDTSIETARDLLPHHAVIGMTCHDQLSLATTAALSGADYVAFGAFYPSKTKPDAKPAPLTLLAEAKTILSCPIVAIGGITVDNAYQTITAGADMIAVVHSLFSAESIIQQAEAFALAFNRNV
ncbi:thiamine phosphate synthase [Neptunomonas antarctica]|uniref:Thiamine-phosphate synthase n=1 Tax=Neptunomonas antarctica TaxID=619304 RepID=A0A1N7PLP3_9GAMM|nr:thiamine phosphate synthase [Neptunomonas antarctica]SIT11573.1 thiamine-phosphate diphosphorylase [Neptunomonas antarctica]